MYKTSIRLAIASAIIATIASFPASAQTSLEQILNGQTIPYTMKIKDLSSQWRGLSTSGQFEMGNTFQSIFSSFFGGALNATYYTKGQTVTIAGETYIVAYSLQGSPEKFSNDLPLSLSLLNLRTIGSLNNIRAFNLKTESEMLKKQIESAPMFPSPRPTNSPKPRSSDR
jgi:hypothetical protein